MTISRNIFTLAMMFSLSYLYGMESKPTDNFAQRLAQEAQKLQAEIAEYANTINSESRDSDLSDDDYEREQQLMFTNGKQEQTSDKQIITVISSDGISFELTKSEAQKSPVLNAMLIHELREKRTNHIELKEIDTECLKIIVDMLKAEDTTTYSKKILNVLKEYPRAKQKLIADIEYAADYLGINLPPVTVESDGLIKEILEATLKKLTKTLRVCHKNSRGGTQTNNARWFAKVNGQYISVTGLQTNYPVCFNIEHKIPAHHSICILLHGSLLIIGSTTGSICTYSLELGTNARPVLIYYGRPIRDLFIDDNILIATNHEVKNPICPIWNLKTNEPIETININTNNNSAPNLNGTNLTCLSELSHYQLFSHFLISELPLSYAYLLTLFDNLSTLKMIDAALGKSAPKITLNAWEQGVLKELLDTIAQGWGNEAKQAIEQELKQYINN